MTAYSMVPTMNLALARLGETPLKDVNQDIDPADNSKVANLMRATFPQCLRAVTEARPWTFATRRFSSPLSVADGGNKTLFDLTSAVITVLEVYRNKDYDPLSIAKTGWIRESAGIRLQDPTIHDGGNTLWCWVLADINLDDDTKVALPPMFLNCVALYTAATLCMSLTENQQLQSALWNEYFSVALPEAASSDGGQGGTEIVNSSILTGVRYA